MKIIMISLALLMLVVTCAFIRHQTKKAPDNSHPISGNTSIYFAAAPSSKPRLIQLYLFEHLVPGPHHIFTDVGGKKIYLSAEVTIKSEEMTLVIDHFKAQGILELATQTYSIARPEAAKNVRHPKVMKTATYFENQPSVPPSFQVRIDSFDEAFHRSYFYTFKTKAEFDSSIEVLIESLQGNTEVTQKLSELIGKQADQTPKS